MYTVKSNELFSLELKKKASNVQTFVCCCVLKSKFFLPATPTLMIAHVHSNQGGS